MANSYVWVSDIIGENRFDTLVINDQEEFYVPEDWHSWGVSVKAWYRKGEVEIELPHNFVTFEEARAYCEQIAEVMYRGLDCQSRFVAPEAFCAHTKNGYECQRPINHAGEHYHEDGRGMQVSWLGRKMKMKKVGANES